MGDRIKLSDLARMTDEERRAVVREFTRDAKGSRKGQAAELNARIRTFEERYAMSSAEMCANLKRHEMAKTADIARWLYLLDARDDRARG